MARSPVGLRLRVPKSPLSLSRRLNWRCLRGRGSSEAAHAEEGAMVADTSFYLVPKLQ